MNSVYLNNKDVFIIVPAYNESKGVIEPVITELLNQHYTVVIVDDGSDTKQQIYCRHNLVHILRHKINLGQGAALQTGTLFALQHAAKYLVHFDADGQHLVSDIPTLLSPLLNNSTDIVFGSRFLRTSSGIPKNKKLLLRFARYINYLFTGILLTDAHNGLRALTVQAASKMQLTENRMAHASEILFLVKKHKFRFTEVPVQIRYTDYSKRKGQSPWNGIRIFFDLLLHKLFE